MQLTKGRFVGRHSLTLVSTSCLPDCKPKAVVLLVHGIGEHSGRYHHVIEVLVARGHAVYTLDHRGHGESQGVRAHVDRFDDFVDDLRLLALEARRAHPTLPAFMVGHSLGGLVALRYALRYQAELAGLVLSAPAIQVGDDVPAVVKRLGWMLATFAPRWAIIPMTRAESPLSRDPQVQMLVDADPLNYKGKVRARIAYEIMTAAQDARRRAAALTVPLLLLHGTADRITNPEGSRQLYAQARSADKLLKLWDDCRHEIFNELEKDEILRFVADWIDARTERPGET